jgi:hypothetical protein
MHTCSDIRAQVQADAQLQNEISQALLAVSSVGAAAADPRMIRVLTRILEASWHEHVSFQDEVLFPILIGRHQSDIEQLIVPSRSQHSSLASCHAEVARKLDAFLHNEGPKPEQLSELLRSTHAQRRLHLEFDATLDGWLPADFTDAEKSLCEKWSSIRHPRFPLNVLIKGERPFPRLGGSRVH